MDIIVAHTYLYLAQNILKHILFSIFGMQK